MSPEEQLDSFIDKFTPEIVEITRQAISTMRTKLPGALLLVYDNYNALAIGFGPTEKSSEAIFSIAVYPRWVSLFFLQAAGIADPHGLLKGTGNVAKHIVLENASGLDKPEVQELMESALQVAKVPLDATQQYRLIIKSISEKQRPRRSGK